MFAVRLSKSGQITMFYVRICARLPSFLRFYIGSRREEPINFFRTVETKCSYLLSNETDSEYSSAVENRTASRECPTGGRPTNDYMSN